MVEEWGEAAQGSDIFSITSVNAWPPNLKQPNRSLLHFKAVRLEGYILVRIALSFGSGLVHFEAKLVN